MNWLAISTLSPLIGQMEAVTKSSDGELMHWIVNILTTIIGTMILVQWREVKGILADLHKMVNNHETRIAVLETKVDNIKEDHE